MFSLRVSLDNKEYYFYKIPQQIELENVLRQAGFEIDHSVVDRDKPFPNVYHSGIKEATFSIVRINDNFRVTRTPPSGIIEFLNSKKKVIQPVIK